MARPTTVSDAAARLDLSERQVQRLAAAGELGPTRGPTRAEQKRYGFPAHQIILDGDRVRQLRARRTRAEIRRERAR